MASHVEGVEAVEGVSHTTQPLADVTDKISANAHRTEAVSEAFDGAMTRAMHLPGAAPKVVDERVQMTGLSEGAVGEQREAIVSDVARDGAVQPAEVEENGLDHISARFRELYVEMTNWQVAWSIAQRTQQDTSHLLKGS